MTEQESKKIFTQYHIELFAFIKAIIGCHRKSELIAVHCFIALMLRGADNPKQFLFDQAQYECRRYADQPLEENCNLKGCILSFDVISRIVNAIRRLTAEQISIVNAIRYEGLMVKETAARLGITVDSVRVQYAKSKWLVHEVFNDQTLLE